MKFSSKMTAKISIGLNKNLVLHKKYFLNTLIFGLIFQYYKNYYPTKIIFNKISLLGVLLWLVARKVVEGVKPSCLHDFRPVRNWLWTFRNTNQTIIQARLEQSLRYSMMVIGILGSSYKLVYPKHNRYPICNLYFVIY